MESIFQLILNRLPPLGKTAEGAPAFCLPSLTGSSDAFIALALSVNQPKIILAITSGIPHADRLIDDLQLLTSDSKLNSFSTRILEFPPLIPDDKGALGTRIKTIAAIKAWSINPYPCVVVAPFAAIAAPIPNRVDAINSETLSVKNSTSSTTVKRPTMQQLIERFSQIGYRRMPMVEQEGDFSVRGGILDIWSPGDEFPVRAEFFGDELETLRTFDAASQISIAKISSTEILPITTSSSSPNCDNLSLFDLLPAQSGVLALEHNEYSLTTLHSFTSSTENRLFTLYTGDPSPKGIPSYNFQIAALPGFAELSADETHHPELFESARKRLNQHLNAATQRGDTILRIDDLSGGFELPNFIVVTKSDRVFIKRRLHVRKATQRGQRLNDFDDLEPGEYVVHLDYGVGRFIGSTEITATDGKRNEVFTIEYADGAKLHVPAAHAHLLSKYIGVKGEAVRLHRLDGKKWKKDRESAQKAVSDLAAALLETQARRSFIPGFAYTVNCEGREAFEAAFPYQETPDQLSAIAAVENDLAAPKPMDRLICGDAGYGKTEVAMRAAFIAAMNGKQVAVLTPTTVLAEHHFETFTSRFDGTPIRIENVSRFQSTTTHDGTFKRLSTGICDIVIGTHAILSNKIHFHDLGLIIIDEEQRFGVRHKEFLKRLRTTADVLTLSATPIPRTLYLSMTGARDLSLLRSPPMARVAVETRIVRDSDDIIRLGIESEIARGGQIYFLHNRVATINKIAKRLLTLVPNARIVIAHGQMDSRTLAQKMRDFERGRFDILLSTTIIESGIDIPRANTIFIDQADHFGMADLYQLRGRVGRSSRQGYAYFLLPPSGDIDADARERLSALKRHGALGSGFNLAVRDLELRGAGNLLGSQQSGHIAAIGFSLYCQLLQRTIAMMKGEQVKTIIDVKLNLEFANPSLPYEYIEEDTLRMSMMKRFAEAQSAAAIKTLVAELKDRFGRLPPPAKEFVKMCELKVACARAGIGKVDASPKRAILYYAKTGEVASVVSLSAMTTEKRITEICNAIP